MVVRASSPEEVRDALAHPRVVAVGETGLDFFYDNAPREAQLRSFARHLEMAVDAGLPVVVHSREAAEETAEALASFGGTVVLHCFRPPVVAPGAATEASASSVRSGQRPPFP